MDDPFEGRALREALDLLADYLIEADENYRRDRRTGIGFAAVALGRFAEYLDKRRSAQGHPYVGFQQPMNDLAGALLSLEDGADDPLFEPAPAARAVLGKGGGVANGKKPGLPYSVLSARAFFAACLQAAIDAKLKGPAAAAYVVKWGGDHPVFRNLAGKPANSLARWRTEFRATRVTCDLAELPRSADTLASAAASYNSQVKMNRAIVLRKGWTENEMLAFIKSNIANQATIRGRVGTFRKGPGETAE